MRLSKSQQYILVFWLFSLVGMLMWVPYKAAQKDSRGDNISVSAGYSWVFISPSYTTCVNSITNHFGRNRGRGTCRLYFDTQKFSLTFVGSIVLLVATLIFVGLTNTRTKKPTLNGRNGKSSLDKVSSRAVNSEMDYGVKDPRELGLPLFKPRPDLIPVGVRLLRSNPDLPISTGDLTQANPLVITAKRDYVSVEFVVIDILHAESPDTEFQKKGQALLGMGDRSIDRVDYDFKPKGAKSWVGVRSYYFDITEGFRNLGG